MLKSHKYWLGLFWLFAIFVLPLPLIKTLADGLQNTLNSSNLFASQIGIIAYVWMLFVIAISTKPKWLDKLIGLPEMYFVHGIIGVGAIILALIHKILMHSSGLIKLTGETSLYILIGIAAYSIFFMSGWLTSRIRLFRQIRNQLERFFKYEVSVWLHRLNIVATLLVFGHVILISYLVAIKPFMMIFYLYSGITSLMYIYYHVVSPLTYRKGQLIENNQLAHSISEITILLKRRWNFKPGDFVYLSFPDIPGMKELHPFSILEYNSKTKTLVFAIRNWNDFTAKLSEIPIGTKVSIDGSFGRLFEEIKEHKNKELVFIGSGVGSVPLISLTASLIEKRRVSFIRVATKQEDLIYENYLKNLATSNENLYYFSQLGRLTIKEVEKIVAKNKNAFFLVGGSNQMMMGTMKLLKDAGIKKSQMYGEKFSF